MNYSITIDTNIDFAPATEVAEILQNVKTIISTRKGTVPLDRDFGIGWKHLDKPLPVARSLMQAEIIDAIEQYEPRAKVVSIKFDEGTEDALQGILRPRVTINIGNEEEYENE